MTTEMIVIPLLKTALLPMVVGGTLAWILQKRVGDRTQELDWVAGLSLLTGYLAGFFAISGFNFPPVLINDWLPYTLLLFLPVLVFVIRRSELVFILTALLAFGVATFIHVRPRFQVWSAGEGAIWFLIYLIPWFLLWLAWHWATKPKTDLQDGQGEATTLIFVVMMATAISMACIYGSAKMSQLAGCLGSVSGGLYLLRLIEPQLKIGSIVAGLSVMLVGGVMIQAHIYAEIAPLALGLVLLASLTVLSLRIPGFTGWAFWKKLAFAVIVNAIPIAVALIYLSRIAAANEYDYY